MYIYMYIYVYIYLYIYIYIHTHIYIKGYIMHHLHNRSLLFSVTFINLKSLVSL